MPGATITFNGTQLSETAGVFYVTQLSFVTTTTQPTPAPPPTTTAPVQADVTISGVTGSCPTVTLLVGNYSLNVSASTGYSGATCADLRAGVTVNVLATRIGTSSIFAVSGIAIRRGPTSTPPAVQPVEGEGVITGLSTGASCPGLQFVIGTYVIRVDASTLYAGAVCTDLKAGLDVYVKGAMNADGSVSASSIAVRVSPPPSNPEVEGEGVVTGIVNGTSCPALQVQIGEYTVTLTGSTQFVGGSCSRVVIGKTLDVRGTMTGARTATASLVTFRN